MGAWNNATRTDAANTANGVVGGPYSSATTGTKNYTPNFTGSSFPYASRTAAAAASESAYPNGNVWVQYFWTTPVTINATRAQWYNDGAGVQSPSATVDTKIQYWDGSLWRDVQNVRNASGAPVGGIRGPATNTNNIWLGVTFDPVTTDTLRLVIAQRRTAANSTNGGAGFSEWEVFGVVGQAGGELKADKTKLLEAILAYEAADEVVRERLTAKAAYDEAIKVLTDVDAEQDEVDSAAEALLGATSVIRSIKITA
jgi:hypothetical protein